MVSNIFASKAQPKATRDALDVAARYFLYKLYDATRREPMQWVSLKEIDEAPATIARAVELGWVVLQPRAGSKPALTDEGRRLARKGRQAKAEGVDQGRRKSKTAKPNRELGPAVGAAPQSATVVGISGCLRRHIQAETALRSTGEPAKSVVGRACQPVPFIPSTPFNFSPAVPRGFFFAKGPRTTDLC
jgi:hypothetical protein